VSHAEVKKRKGNKERKRIYLFLQIHPFACNACKTEKAENTGQKKNYHTRPAARRSSNEKGLVAEKGTRLPCLLS